MSARIDDLNFDPKFKVAMSDIATLLAIQNFCLDNLKAILEKIISSKKGQDQLNENNDLMNYMILVISVMDEFLLRINQNFYHNKELEENEFLQKQTQEGNERLEELNRLFSQVVTIQLRDQKIRESEYAIKKAQLENDLKILNKELRQAIYNVESRKAQLFQTNQAIEKTFDMILNNILISSIPIEIVINGKTLRISQDESNRAIKHELQEDFDNGTFSVGASRPKVKNAFLKLGIKKLIENNIEHTKLAVATVDQMAETQTNKFMESMQQDVNLNKLNSSIQEREIQKTELNKAEKNVAALEVEVENTKGEIAELRRKYNDVDTTMRQEASTTESEVASSNYDENDLDDPFADHDNGMQLENENQNYRDDGFFPPPGDPDNNNYPDQSPPNYIEASAPSQQPEPSAPPQEEADYPAPSVPPLEESLIPNVPSPAYVERSQLIQPSSITVEPINILEAKIAEPQPEKNVELNAPSGQPSHAELKEIKSSGGILGKLGVSAESLRKDIEKKKVETARSKENKSKHPVNQGGAIAQSKQNEPIESERNGPSHRR